MKARSPFFAACCIAATAFSLALSGCNSREAQAQAALAQYETAAAAGDLIGSRIALLALVAADDSNPAYWAQLGQVQVELGSFEDAYYAFSRAHELDRGNAAPLASLAQLALTSGNVEAAEDHAEKLALLQPDHPVIRLTYGFVALKRSNFDEADRQVDPLLQSSPREPTANQLKARILVARGKLDEAVRLLDAQTRGKPDDAGAWKALMGLQVRNQNWPGVQRAASHLANLKPEDPEPAFAAVDAAFRHNDVASGLRASERFLRPEASPADVGTVLTIWAERWKAPAALDEARKRSRAAPPQHQLAYATYFNMAGSPDDAAALLGGGQPQWPLTAANMSSNSLIAETLALRGQYREAKRVFDAVLAREPDHVHALRGRINLEIRMGAARAAIADAQRLVSVSPRSARERLLLARAYAAAGDQRQLDRTLWDAFHEIPANFLLFEALRAHVVKSGGTEAVARVDAEFRQQQDVELARGFF
jgi:predicted Zn-dependent protease